MSNDSNSPLTPADWFQLSSQSVLDSYNSSTWPWSRLTVEELSGLLLQHEQYLAYYGSNITQKVMWTVCILGVIGGFLIVSTIVRMPKSSRTNFYRITNVIAVLDAMYLVDLIIRQRLMWETERTTVVVVLYSITSGTVFCLSLVGDLLTLALAVERFVALTFPVRYKRMNKRTERRFWNAVIVVSVILSLCRVRYAFASTLYTVHGFADTAFFEFLTLWSDFIMPLILAVVMVLMVVGILFALIKRTCTKVAVQSQDIEKHISACMKTMSLLAVLMVLFLLNQFGYIAFELSFLWRDGADLRYDCSFAEADHYRQLTMSVSIIGNFSVVGEAASKSLTFYQYVMFNASFRNYFFSMFKRLRSVDTSVASKDSQLVRTSVHAKQ